MDKAKRRAAVSSYKERRHAAGVFAIRCTVTGQVWVGATLTPATIQNQLWFGLRLGSYPQRDLQAAWREHGEQAFGLQILEVRDEAEATLMPDAWLKHRAVEWCAQLGAKRI